MTRRVAPCSSSANDCEELMENSEVIKAAPRTRSIVPYLTNMFGRERREPEKEPPLVSPSKRTLFVSDASAFNLLQRKRSKSSPNSLNSARDSRSNSHGSVWSPVPEMHKMSSQVSMCSAATLSTGESSILESLNASQAEEDEDDDEEEELEVLMLTEQQPEEADRSPSRDTARDTAVSGPVDRFQSLTVNDSTSVSEVIPFNSDEILPGRDMVAVPPRKEKRNVDFRFLAAPTPSTLMSELSLSEFA